MTLNVKHGFYYKIRSSSSIREVTPTKVHLFVNVKNLALIV